MSKSAWDRSELPAIWDYRSPVCKAQVIAFLQGSILLPPKWWNPMPLNERLAVVLHLCAVGSVSGREHGRVRQYGHATITATSKAEVTKGHVSLDIETAPFKTFDACPKSYMTMDQAREIVGNFRNKYPELRMLYPPPKGEKRILPSLYTKLRTTWLRASGVWHEPDKMNQGHLKATINLLNESHVNLVDKMTSLLGRMHAHLGNRPDLQAKLIELHHDFEALSVEDLYPIVTLLASYVEAEELEDDVPSDWFNPKDHPF